MCPPVLMVAALLVSDRPLVSGVRGAGRAPSGSCSVRSPRRHLRPVELACLVLAVVLLGLKAADLYQRLVRVLRQAAATPVLLDPFHLQHFALKHLNQT